MTSKRRLFAGFTSLTSNLCCDHFSAIGPEGIRASKLTDHLVTTPVVISNGMLTLPTVITTANAIAK